MEVSKWALTTGTVRHFFHVFADGPGWQEAVDDHTAALGSASHLVTEMVVGIVGSPEHRTAATEKIMESLGTTVVPIVAAEADDGYEQVTLSLVEACVKSLDVNTPVLYTHTKGASKPTQTNVNWRRSMERLLVENLGSALTLLEHSEAVGCHWITPAQFGATFGVRSPFFGGNYWLAQSDYLRRLPPVAERGQACCWRHDAEGWIGLGNPVVSDLRPGWPNY